MTPPLKIAVQMDAIESINIDGDTTFVLMLEAQERRHELYYYQPQQLSLKNGKLLAKTQKISLKREKDNHFKLDDLHTMELSKMDIILMRQDPPFDMNYLTYTYFLDMVKDKTLILNNPSEVRNLPEKIFPCYFPELMPPTLISRDIDEIGSFFNEHKEIILKPLYAYGGNDVFRISSKIELGEQLNMFIQKYNHPFISQAYLPSVTQGDKRIILIDGEIAGAINRVPLKGNIRSNLVQGGTAQETQLTKRDLEICTALKPHLKEHGPSIGRN